MFCIIGAAFAIGSTTYTVGSGARMGPGYFPLMLGVVLILLGGVTLFTSLVAETPDGDRIGAWAWRPLSFVLLANLAFGALLGGLPSINFPAMGMIIAIYALVFISSLAGDQFQFKNVFILATILAAGSYVAFILVLKLQIPVWPTFISG
jgi:hypothetical protein